MTQTGSISGSISQGVQYVTVEIPRRSFAAADWSAVTGGYAVTVTGSRPIGVFRTTGEGEADNVICDIAVADGGITITAPAAFAGYALTV